MRRFIFFFLLGLFLSFIPQFISGSAPFANISETARQVTEGTGCQTRKSKSGG
jgi:hypothetical protein